MVVDQNIRNCVGEISAAFHSAPINIIFHRTWKNPVEDGRASDAVGPGDRPAIGVKPCSEAAIGRGAIKIVLHVFLARPGFLDGCSDGFGHFHRIPDEVLLASPSETSTEISRVNEDGFGRHAGNFCGGILRGCLPLRGRPDFAAVGANVRGAVHGFHGGVREKRSFVYSFDFICRTCEHRLRVAFGARDGAGLSDSIREELANSVARNFGVRSFVPGDLKSATSFHRRPGVVGYHGDAG